MSTLTSLKVIKAETLPPLAEHLDEFLSQLGGPTAIKIAGKDTSRSRVVCTLLHGNEPSGTWAIHQWLRAMQKGDVQQPATSILFIIANVEAALLPPIFTHRQVPERKDLNRCFFQNPCNSPEYQLAQAIAQIIIEHQPEAVVDMHNTSGSGPGFAITTQLDEKHQALACLFTDQLIVTNLKLGALMELSEHHATTITVECGGAQEHRSKLMAQSGLERLLRIESLCDAHCDQEINIYDNPLRLCLKPSGSLAFGSSADHPHADLILPHTIAQLNEALTPSATVVGQLGPRGLEALTACDGSGVEQVQVFFDMDHKGRLITKSDVQCFMATHRKDIALSDCLFYFAPIG